MVITRQLTRSATLMAWLLGCLVLSPLAAINPLNNPR